MIKINKCKRRDGGKFLIYTTEGRILNRPIVGEVEDNDGRWELVCWTAEGRLDRLGNATRFDLIEVGPYDHIKKGDLVMVWDGVYRGSAVLRRFAGINEDGFALAYGINCIGKVAWKHCLTVEEYADVYLRERYGDDQEGE